MNPTSSNLERRALLRLAAGVAAGSVIGLGAGGTAARAAAIPPAATGKPGDFDFLSGEWTIRHRQWKQGQWDLFTGEATVVGILGGIASIEELRIPERNFSGMGLRLLDVERKLWADYWVNSKSGVLQPPPGWGSFVDGVGTWDGDDFEDGVPSKPIIVRGVWDRITPNSCRWYQAFSRDDGKTWQETWSMDWTRKR
jgi:hypothetical protein